MQDPLNNEAQIFLDFRESREHESRGSSSNYQGHQYLVLDSEGGVSLSDNNSQAASFTDITNFVRAVIKDKVVLDESDHAILDTYKWILETYKSSPEPTGMFSGSKVKQKQQNIGKGKALLKQARVIDDEFRSIMSSVESGSPEARLLFKGKKIGAGGFGKVYEARDITAGKIEASGIIKYAYVPKNVRRELGDEEVDQRLVDSKHDMEQEDTVLAYVHSDRVIPGIQEPHLWSGKIITVKEKKDGFAFKEKFGCQPVRYDKDYSKLGNATINQFLDEFSQLAGGLKFLADANILHGDIKGTNILVKVGPDGEKQAHIADFGGARLAGDKKVSLEEIMVHGHTPPFMPKEDLDLANKYADKSYQHEISGNQKKSKRSRKKLIELKKKSDVYSMGTTFYCRLMGEFPYELDRRGYPDFGNGYQDIEDPNIPQELKNLIRAMLHPDPDQRPTAEQVRSSLDELRGSGEVNGDILIEQRGREGALQRIAKVKPRKMPGPLRKLAKKARKNRLLKQAKKVAIEGVGDSVRLRKGKKLTTQMVGSVRSMTSRRRKGKGTART
jgi:serine/threonine protein kinase